MRNRKKTGKYRAAVVGCGRIGFEFDNDPKRDYVATHAGAYNFIKDTELVAVCDADVKKLEKCISRYNIPGSYTDVEDMMKNENIDILSICTPPHTHYHILKKIIGFPLKAIFCEKPMADSVKKSREMVKLCGKAGIILQVDHQRRFDQLHINLRRLIRDKKLGDVQQVNFYYTTGVKNTGSHMFDLLRFFFGDAEWIQASSSKNKSGKKEDPNLNGVIKFKNGVFATFQACDVKNYLVFELNCLLDKARFVLKNSGFSLDFYKVGASRYFSGYKELYKFRSPFNVGYKRDFMVNAVRHLVKCVKDKKESVSSGRDGLETLRLIDTSVVSAGNNGKRIFL